MEFRTLDPGLPSTPDLPPGCGHVRAFRVASNRESPMNRMRTLPTIRFELVQEVRAKIAAGFYDSPEVLESLLEALIVDRSR